MAAAAAEERVLVVLDDNLRLQADIIENILTEPALKVTKIEFSSTGREAALKAAYVAFTYHADFANVREISFTKPLALADFKIVMGFLSKFPNIKTVSFGEQYFPNDNAFHRSLLKDMLEAMSKLNTAAKYNVFFPLKLDSDLFMHIPEIIGEGFPNFNSINFKDFDRPSYKLGISYAIDMLTTSKPALSEPHSTGLVGDDASLVQNFLDLIKENAEIASRGSEHSFFGPDERQIIRQRSVLSLQSFAERLSTEEVANVPDAQKVLKDFLESLRNLEPSRIESEIKEFKKECALKFTGSALHNINTALDIEIDNLKTTSRCTIS